MPAPKSRSSRRRKTPEILTFLVARLEERTVSQHDLDLILPTHRNGWLRPQIEGKLSTLDRSHPAQADLHHRVSVALELFEAVHAQTFAAPREWPELEPWIQRALAYFVSNTDAIPDHFADGYEDDHREFLQLGERLGVLLDAFEAQKNKPRP